MRQSGCAPSWKKKVGKQTNVVETFGRGLGRLSHVLGGLGPLIVSLLRLLHRLLARMKWGGGNHICHPELLGEKPGSGAAGAQRSPLPTTSLLLPTWMAPASLLPCPHITQESGSNAVVGRAVQQHCPTMLASPG